MIEAFNEVELRLKRGISRMNEKLTIHDSGRGYRLFDPTKIGRGELSKRRNAGVRAGVRGIADVCVGIAADESRLGSWEENSQ